MVWERQCMLQGKGSVGRRVYSSRSETEAVQCRHAWHTAGGGQRGIHPVPPHRQAGVCVAGKKAGCTGSICVCAWWCRQCAAASHMHRVPVLPNKALLKWDV